MDGTGKRKTTASSRAGSSVKQLPPTAAASSSSDSSNVSSINSDDWNFFELQRGVPTVNTNPKTSPLVTHDAVILMKEPAPAAKIKVGTYATARDADELMKIDGVGVSSTLETFPPPEVPPLYGTPTTGFSVNPSLHLNAFPTHPTLTRAPVRYDSPEQVVVNDQAQPPPETPIDPPTPLDPEEEKKRHVQGITLKSRAKKKDRTTRLKEAVENNHPNPSAYRNKRGVADFIDGALTIIDHHVTTKAENEQLKAENEQFKAENEQLKDMNARWQIAYTTLYEDQQLLLTLYQQAYPIGPMASLNIAAPSGSMIAFPGSSSPTNRG